MEKRNDIHRPSVIQPENYAFVAIVFNGDGIDVAMMNAEQQKILRDHLVHTGGKFSQHAHGGSCHICGAWAATVAYFHHIPSNKYIVTGETCCSKLEEGHEVLFRTIRDEATAMKHATAGKLKAIGTLKEHGLEAAWLVFDGKGLFDAEALGWEEGKIWDIVRKLVRFGSLSDAQYKFLNSLMGKIGTRAQRDAERQAEVDAASPVPVSDKRITVCGKVLSIKHQETDYGTVTRMLVKHADGWKLWGSVPSSIDEWDYESNKHSLPGKDIQFDAMVTASDDDPKFGFYKRPTKASVIGS